MLTFFRRIRKALLGSGQVRKYLIYAIGEIALVVIGILIALQINNWNEWRKSQQKVVAQLRSLQGDLKRDIQEFKTAYRIYYFQFNSFRYLLSLADRVPQSMIDMTLPEPERLLNDWKTPYSRYLKP